MTHPARSVDRRARGVLDLQGHAVVVLAQARHLRPEAHVGAGQALQVRERDLGEAVLAEVDVVRVVDEAVEDVHVPLDLLARGEAAEPDALLGAEPQVLDLAEESQALEAVEHRVRVDHRARRRRHGRFALEHGDADARAGEAEGVEQADRPAPDDDDVLAHRAETMTTR